MKIFKFRESLKNAWEIYKKNWEIIVVSIVASLIITAIVPSEWIGLDVVISTIVGVILIKLAITLFENKKAEISDLSFNSADAIEIAKSTLLFWVVSFGAIMVAAFVGGLGILTGFLIGKLIQLSAPWMLGFIFGGILASVLFIWLAVRATFIMTHIVKNAQHKGSWNTIKQAWNMTEGHVGTIIIYGIKVTLLNLAGIIALVIGLVITIPLSQIMKIDLYHRLLNK